MIDIHHHCLPDVDDGPREWDEAVAMLAMAAEEGIETIVATPHVLRGRWPVRSPQELADRAAMLREKTNDTPRLLLGSEYFFSHDMADVLQAGDSIVPLAGSRYVLIELAANSVPPMFEQPLYRAQLNGWIPILAHPERNLVYQEHPELLAALIHHGARTQVTATSLLGAFGNSARTAAETFLRLGLVHFVATDAHNTDKRPPRIREALGALREIAGERATTALTRDNPQAVLDNRPLPFVPDPAEERAVDGLFTRLWSFFRSR
jgi:protein-tyrosine phosphatase